MRRLMKTGDAIATFAQPIARGIDAVFGTNIRNCPGCKRMQHNLNMGMNLADAFYDRFWNNNNKGNNTMQYVVNKTQTEQIAVEANDTKEAVAKAKNGEGKVTASSENFSAIERPTQQQITR